MSTLPIHAVLPSLQEALALSNAVVLEAPPGAGKTTVVPLALKDAPWLDGRRIVMLEPRRVAARLAAEYMARELGEPIGATVGYRIRFDSKVGPATRIEVVTEGILTRMLQDDPALEAYGLVIFDEFHERHLQADLGLALALDAQAQLRPELRLLVMSATLDGERLARHLGAERVRSEGRSFPVSVDYDAGRREEPLPAKVARGVERALAESEGDVLVFLPGKREIQLAINAIGERCPEVEALPLHGDLSVDAQARAVAPAAVGQRRVIVATNVAESSLTLPGVRAVVDSGLARESRFDPSRGFATLKTVSISAASATQRAGRAGRLGPGWCLRLWPREQRLDAELKPEIAITDLSGLALDLKRWGEAELRFLDPPPPGHLAQANTLLADLGALDAQGRLNAHGRALGQYGTHPRLANMLLRARDGRARALACDLLALIESRDPLTGDARRQDDLRLRWKALAAWRQRRGGVGADPLALKAIDHLASQWRRRLKAPEPPAEVAPHELGDLLLHAYADRVAISRDKQGLRYAMSNGRGASLRPDSGLRGETWLVIADFADDAADATIRQALPFDADRLAAEYPERLSRSETIEVDPNTDAVSAWAIERFGALELSKRRVPVRDPATALLGLVRARGLGVLDIGEELAQWRLRVQRLREWCPELGLPDLSDAALLATLEDWLLPWLSGRTQLKHLGSGDLAQALKGLLDREQLRRVEAEAPKALTVPSGMTRALVYRPEEPPVLAVKLQELFGCADTPRIAMGRVSVVLHLLSPGGRPVQVTRDLKGFWDRTYADVKKDLKGRYPRHPWPDDPWAAQPTHRAKPRGT